MSMQVLGSTFEQIEFEYENIVRKLPLYHVSLPEEVVKILLCVLEGGYSHSGVGRGPSFI